MFAWAATIAREMLPTPSTSHVRFDTIYEPSEDSYLFLDTLSSTTEREWLSSRFNSSSSNATYPLNSPQPTVLEVGTGSGVVLAFIAANADVIFGRTDIITFGTDVNSNACLATRETVQVALNEKLQARRGNEYSNTPQQQSPASSVQPAAVMTADLCGPFRVGAIDVLVFNPPYVPTPELPDLPDSNDTKTQNLSKFETESYLLSLTYAGGDCGMETTNRLLESVPQILSPDRGVAYVLLCAQNKPSEVIARIEGWGSGWTAEIVGRSGSKAGWESLVIVRIWNRRETS